jgi:hypothetical protein
MYNKSVLHASQPRSFESFQNKIYFLHASVQYLIALVISGPIFKTDSSVPPACGIAERIIFTDAMIIEGQFQNFQRFFSSKLVLITVESCLVALNYYGDGSITQSLNNIPSQMTFHQPPIPSLGTGKHSTDGVEMRHYSLTRAYRVWYINICFRLLKCSQMCSSGICSFCAASDCSHTWIGGIIGSTMCTVHK